MIILDTLSNAFESLVEHKTRLFNILVAPFVLLVAFSLFEFFYGDSLSLVISLAVPFFIGMIAAIATFRIILIGEKSVSLYSLIVLKSRELKFMGYGLGILLLLIPLLMIYVIPFFGKPIAVVTLFYLFSRVSLVFPAVATDNSLSFSEAWNMTKKFKVQKLVLITGLLLIALIATGFLVQAIPGAGWIANIIVFSMLIYLAAVLSIIYNQVSRT